MSYCRWSDMDFGCDLYCFESDSGFETYVAGRRVVGEVPKQLPWSDPDFFASHQAQMKFLETAEREPIGLPHDGEHFLDSTLEDFLRTLRMLKGVGYRVPDYVFKEVREKIKDLSVPPDNKGGPK